MKISMKLNESLDHNAQIYFKKAKKLRKKISGAEKAIEITKQKILKAENADKEKVSIIKKIKKKLDKKWFEKFHWFITSNGFLVIAGRDASTNEDVIKKYTDKEDIVLHTDMAGSPFAVIKKESKEIDIFEKDIEEAADFILAYSRAWKKGYGSADIFYVNPDQVSKTANPGEHLSSGAFMVRGKTNYIQNKINFCIGMYNENFGDYSNKVFAGPEEAAKIHCKKYFKLVPGRQKISEIARIVRADFCSNLDLDEFIRSVPSNSELKMLNK